jgi:glycosyltransferase involved in cell wall biosynthesis
MKRLSIIVPIYNVENYVERCLRSLEDQNIPKDSYEIICINDGSPDKCREIIVGLQTEYNNIILIDQENQGVSCARNNGIKNASGKYLLFIDPDDYVDRDCLDGILNTADEYDAQVLLF